MIYRFGVFDFEADSGQLRKHARPVSLERQPARVLAVLLARAGELVSREELRESVWGRETHVDFDRGLAYCLSQIRGALGDRGDNPRFVQTFPKRGYKFIVPVTVDTDPAVSSIEAASPAERPARTRVALVPILAAVSLALVLAAVWFFVNRRSDAVLIAVSVFDNETGVAEYDRPIAGLADLVVADLTNLAPGRLGVIGNAEVLRRPRNIRNLRLWRTAFTRITYCSDNCSRRAGSAFRHTFHPTPRPGPSEGEPTAIERQQNIRARSRSR